MPSPSFQSRSSGTPSPPFSSSRRGFLEALVAGSLVTSLVASPRGVFAQAAPARAPIHIALVEGLSGPFGNTGEAVYRNVLWATERVNARGGVRLRDGTHALQVERYDTQGDVEAALAALRAANDAGIRVVMQGNSSAVAAALINAIDRNNQRDPATRTIFLNYAAVDPALTNERCSPWHFRFDAHTDMRLAALMTVLRDDSAVKRVYLIGQDYSFGRTVVEESAQMIAKERPDIRIVGNELHPLGRIKDFAPYAAKIMAARADAVVTGNWGNDLTLLVRAAHDAGFRGRFYTFYGNALGAPEAIRDAGIGRVYAVADWLPNVPTPESAAFYRAFRARFPKPADDYPHMRMQLMIEALVQGYEKAGSEDMTKVAQALASADVTLAGQHGHMRPTDHQFQQPLVVGVMDRVGTPGVPFDVEGSGFGFRVVKSLTPEQAEMPTTCRM
jgi:branched-chain amino acid transport system substrate-binding protein